MTERTVYEQLRRYAVELTPAAGIDHPEISHGQIVMMMSPVKRQELAARRLRRQLEPQVGETHPGYIAETGPQVESVTLGVMRRPDLVVLPEASLDEEGESVDASEVLLVAEIVSRTNPENDYVGKMRDYPAMGIPHYLIIDPRTGVCHHHTRPVGHGDQARYDKSRDYDFGEIITIGEWTVDSGEFPRYGK
ncbi:Uma2 family endonuclease [Streptomyces sp. NPDC037389]|uniref:Uma2 family endonuclease n=1 Tax=Streptomyces sp. NPDC037389 TaxID=3155369 RepID=UPI0033EEFA20